MFGSPAAWLHSHVFPVIVLHRLAWSCIRVPKRHASHPTNTSLSGGVGLDLRKELRFTHYDLDAPLHAFCNSLSFCP